MYELFKKNLTLLFLSLKLVIVFVVCYFIYQKLDLYLFENNVPLATNISKLSLIFFISLLLLLSTLNWILEIFKWKLLVSGLQSITFFESLIQSLVAHTVSLITPLKSGEFVVKTMFYKRNFVKKIIDLNFIGNINQLMITLLFGIIGFYFYQHIIIEPLNWSALIDHKYIVLLIIFLVLIFLMIFIIKMNWIKFHTISFKIYFQISGISLLRYFIFSHQYLLLIFIFYPNLSYLQTIAAIFCMYLLASIIPTLALFDWAIKGTIGVFLFSVLGVKVEIILLVSLIMWIFNFALPAILGSYFLITFTGNKLLVND